MTSSQTSFWDLSTQNQEHHIGGTGVAAAAIAAIAAPVSPDSTNCEMSAFNGQPLIHSFSSFSSNGPYPVTDQPFPFDHNGPSMEIPTGKRQAQKLSKQQWEKLKPIVRQHYVIQKLRFDQVIKILQDQHGLTITRRQFYRKIDDWKFAKNLKATEMRKLVEDLKGGNEFNGRLMFHEAEATLAKIKRYKRNSKRTAMVSHTSVGLISSLPAHSSIVQDRSMSSIHGGLVPLDPTMAVFRDETVPTASIFDIEALSPSGSSPDWNEVDVPGSPNLSRLFRALDLESSKDIPDISLENPGEDEYQYLSTEQVKSLCPLQAGQVDWATDSSEKQISNGEAVQTFNYLNANLNDSEDSTNMFFRSDRTCKMLLELSPFSNTTQEQPPWWIRWHNLTACELKQQQLEHEQVLTKLGNLLSTSHPTILQIKSNLGGIYEAQGANEVSKAIFKEIASTASEIYGPEHIKTLEASLQVFEKQPFLGLLALDIQEAQKLYDTIHTFFPPEHNLARRSSQILCYSLFGTGRHLEAIIIARNSLQIELTISGPHSIGARRMMMALAMLFSCDGLYSESEQLLRTAMQLLRGNLTSNKRSTLALMSDMGRILLAQWRLDECLAVYRKVAAEYELLGLRQAYLITLFDLAVVLKTLGRFEEGENLCKEVLERQRELVGVPSLDLFYTSHLMAAYLMQRREYEEAATFYEYAFKGLEDILGIQFCQVTRICLNLGKCYQSLGRIDDALNLYQNTLERLSKAEGADDKEVERLQEMIARLELQQDSEDRSDDGSSSNSDNEMGGH